MKKNYLKEFEKYGYSEDWEDDVLSKVLEKLNLECDGQENGYVIFRNIGECYIECYIDYYQDRLVELNEEELENLIVNKLDKKEERCEKNESC